MPGSYQSAMRDFGAVLIIATWPAREHPVRARMSAGRGRNIMVAVTCARRANNPQSLSQRRAIRCH
jgi:hypothetical protein